MLISRTFDDVPAQQNLLVDFLIKSDVGFALFDLKLRYQAVNPWLATTNGLPVDQHLGKHLREVVGEISATVEPALQSLLSTGRPILNFRLEGAVAAKPKQRKEWVANFFPVKDKNGHVQQIAAIVTETFKELERRGRNLDSSTPHANGDLLRSWKEIAGYLGTCSKTVQRWERQYRLPVRRIMVNKGAVVFAFKSEVESWMRGQSRKADDQRN
jgi:PAS fold